jgi:hypothetical protein
MSDPTRPGMGLARAAALLFAAGFALAAAALAAGFRAGGWTGAALAGGAALGLGLAVAARLGGRAAAPLSSLAEEAEAIRRFDLAERPLPASPIAEFQRLSGAIGGMKSALSRFGIYVPRDLARKLVAEGAEARLGGERRPLTILFSDVEDFTALSERLDPDELMRVASAYFEAMTGALLAHEATIDKFIGDSVMALWSAPRRDLAHAAHACRARLAALPHAVRRAQRGGGGRQCRILGADDVHGDGPHGESRRAARGPEQALRHGDPGVRGDAARRRRGLRLPPGGPGAAEGRLRAGGGA